VSGLPELTCRQMVELVTDYLEDRLTPAERARFDAHVALCEGCQAYLEQFRATIRALGSLPEESLSPGARDALLAAFHGWPREGP
jgi:anti-sigma factor RsiW